MASPQCPGCFGGLKFILAEPSASASSSRLLEFKRRRRRILVSVLVLIVVVLLFVQLPGAVVQFAHSRPVISYPHSQTQPISPPLGRRPTAATTKETSHSVSSSDYYSPPIANDLMELAATNGAKGPAVVSKGLPNGRPKRGTAPATAAATAGIEVANGSSSLTLRKQHEDKDIKQRLAEFKKMYVNNRALDDTAYYVLFLVYSSLIAIGTVSNLLICLTVVLKPQVLSPRNIFIVNLACSDLLLCVFTMPFSFIEISMKLWSMGLIPCKLVAGLQATSIFVSTISITAIALDRYKVIVYPTHQETSGRTAALILGSVWLGALLLSSPLFCFRTVQHLPLPHKIDNVDSINYCVELWPINHGRGIYSVISMIVQYVVPITIVCSVYLKISRKLKKRLIRRQRLTQLECQQKRQLNLIKRTHTMLVSVALVFILSWLPLNLLNLIGDFSDVFKDDTKQFRLVFAICHLIGCSSACSNPILYGYLNENFRKELHQVYSYHLSGLAHLFRRGVRRILCCLGCRSADGSYAQQSPTSSLKSYQDEDESPSETSSSSSNPSDGSQNSAPESGDQTKPPPENISENRIVAADDDSRASGAGGKSGGSTLGEQRTSMGRTMQFCLCVANGAGSSSTETLGNQKQQRRRQSRNQSSVVLNANDCDDPTPTTTKGGSGHRRKEKRFRCECQCHQQALGDNNSNSNSNNSNNNNKTSGRSSGRKKGVENNGFVCLQEQLRRFSKCSTTSQQHQHQQQRDSARPSAGRRVWLRFWPAPGSSSTRHQQQQQQPASDDDEGADKRVVAARRGSFQQQQQRRQKGQSSGGGGDDEDELANRQLDAEQSLAIEANNKQQGQTSGSRPRRGVDKQDKTKDGSGGGGGGGSSSSKTKEKKRPRYRSKGKGKGKGRGTKKEERESGRTNSGSHCDSCREVAAAKAAQCKSSRAKRLFRSSSNGSRRKKNELQQKHQQQQQLVVSPSGGDGGEQRQVGQRWSQKRPLLSQVKETGPGGGEGRIEGLEMGLMLVGPGKRELPSQFAGALYLSVTTTTTTNKRRTYDDDDADDDGSERCSLAHERSTSYLALESTSFALDPPQLSAAQFMAESKAEIPGQQSSSSMVRSSIDVSADNDEPPPQARRRSLGNSVGPRNGHELVPEPFLANGGQQVAAAAAEAAAANNTTDLSSAASLVRVVVDHRDTRLAGDNNGASEVVDERRFYPASRQQASTGATKTTTTTTGVQPERPVSGLEAAPIPVQLRAAADDNDNSNSSSSMCLTHSQWHSTTNSSASSCTCSLVSSTGSSGRSSCASQPAVVAAAAAAAAAAPSPGDVDETAQVSATMPALVSPTTGSALAGAVAQSQDGDHEFISDRQRHRDHQHQDNEQKHVSSCSSSPLDQPTGETPNSSRSSSLRSWASLEVARLMAHSGSAHRNHQQPPKEIRKLSQPQLSNNGFDPISPASQTSYDRRQQPSSNVKTSAECHHHRRPKQHDKEK